MLQTLLGLPPLFRSGHSLQHLLSLWADKKERKAVNKAVEQLCRLPGLLEDADMGNARSIFDEPANLAQVLLSQHISCCA